MQAFLRATMSLLLLVVAHTSEGPYSSTDPRHWPTGVQTTGLAPHITSIHNCLDSPNTSSACGPLVRGRLSTSADWCTRRLGYGAGALTLGEVLRNTTIDVILIPAADDIYYEESPTGTGTIGGFVGDGLAWITSSGGFRINAYVINKPHGGPGDTYKGSYTALLDDWASRADMIAMWWTDNPERRGKGIECMRALEP